MSVHLTVVFSNKMMKGLLIFLSVSVRLSVFVSMSSDSETAGAVNTMSGASVHNLSTGQNAAHSFKFKFKFKLSFIVIPLHVGTYSGTKCRASQDHGAT